MKKIVAIALLAFSSLGGAYVQAGAPAPAPEASSSFYDPVDHWEFDLETGALWRFGSNGTPLNYVFLPQMLTFKTPYVMKHEFQGGSVIALRSRFSLLLEGIAEGPESYFFGASASGILEWWNASRKFSLFLSSGGGVGWMDSKGYEVEGAQGQDFNYNWFIYTGARVRVAEKISVGLGAYYQHISNRGEDEVNPGVDTLGPMLSIGWHF